MAAPITIAFVDHAAQIGGAEKSLLELVAHLDRARFAPVILHQAGAEWVPSDPRELRFLPAVPPSTLYDQRRSELSPTLVGNLRRTWQATRIVARLTRELGRLRPALVHTNSTKMHLIAGTAARLRRLPVIWHMRDLLSEPGARQWLARAVRRIRPEVIAISAAVAAQFEGLPCRVHLIPNGIPLDRFAPGPPPPGLRAALGLPPGAPLACVVGRLTPWKGHQVLLRAWADVCDRLPEARLLVVGEVAFWDQSYEQELRELTSSLKLQDHVLWLGFRDDVPDLLRLCDLLVLPSVDEPFGRVLIEAMAAQRPVVATASGGVPEIVVDGETGLLVPPGEPGPLAEALLTVLNDAALAARLGAAGRRRALERFDVRRVAAQVQALYDQVLGL